MGKDWVNFRFRGSRDMPENEFSSFLKRRAGLKDLFLLYREILLETLSTSRRSREILLAYLLGSLARFPCFY